MKEYIILSIESVKNKLNKRNRANCFEIFGYDFLIDKNFHVWLIEVNTNPCLEESSVISSLIHRMIGLYYFLILKYSLYYCFKMMRLKLQLI